MPRTSAAIDDPEPSSAPVLALLIRSADGPWLPAAIDAVRAGSVVPRHVLIVDISERADFDADALDTGDLDVGVVPVDDVEDRDDVVAEALDHAAEYWADPGDWVWVLAEDDDRLPDDECLAALLAVADAEPGIGVLLPRVAESGVPEGDVYPAGEPGALIRVTWEAATDTADPDTADPDTDTTDTDTTDTADTDADPVDETAASVLAAHLEATPTGDTTATEAAPSAPAVGPAARRPPTRWWPGWSRVLTAPPTVLGLALAVVSVLVHGVLADRLGWNLAGGALLPLGDLGDVWSSYVGAWHPVAGGTTSAASPAMAVLGVLGAAGGSPAVAVSVLLLLELPAAGLVAYAAARRLRVGAWTRAGGAAAYALVPAATDAVAAGRLDVVVVHIVAPALVAGLVSLLTRQDVRWLPMSAVCVLGLALLGAFSPITYAVAVVGLLVAFVALPVPPGRTGRGIPALAMVVLLPPVLALPWLPTLVTHPVLVLHGITGPADEADVLGLFGLHPAGGVPLGIALVLAAVVAVVVAPGRRVLPGVVITVLGVAGVVVVSTIRATPVTGGEPAYGYAGGPLIVVGAGLVAIVLGACQEGPAGTTVRPRGAAIAGGAATLAALAAAVAFAAVADQPRGDVRADGGTRLAPALADEVADNGRGVLVLGDETHPDRLAAARGPQFGDDALAPVGGMAERMEGWRYGLLAGSPDAVTDAAAAGVQFVVLPRGTDGSAVRGEAGDLVRAAPPTTDGRTVLRLTPESGQVTLVSPEQAHRAVSGGAPSDELMRGSAIASVDARLPDARVRASDGPEGRLLVLAAEHEPGWTATVDGEPVPITPAWGHQVAVSVPESSSEIVVQYTSPAHGVFLLGSVAALLFTVLTAIPGGRHRSSPRGA